MRTVLLAIFLVLQTPTQAESTRTPVQLPAMEHQIVLAEMRSFLETVQQISRALSTSDFPAVAQAARLAGMQEARKVMPRIRPYMPQGFRQMGHSTHAAFDQLALDAELEDPQRTLKQLSEILATCTACHRAYRLEVAQPSNEKTAP